jgi:predicted lipoprotein with Yx(FWY)xxD motif
MVPGRGTALALAIAAPVAGLVILFAVLGSSGDSSDQARAAPPPALRVAKTRLGRVLVDQHGLTLYLFLEDKHHRSTCYGGCARVWPPAVARGPLRVGAGLQRRRLTTTRRRDASRQLVYAGHPLYTTDADVRPGQTEGQGFLGTWFVVSPSGHLIGHPKRGGAAY